MNDLYWNYYYYLLRYILLYYQYKKLSNLINLYEQLKKLYFFPQYKLVFYVQNPYYYIYIQIT